MSYSDLDKYYEEKYESPLWRMIKKRAEERDISYSAAYWEVLPEYQKTIRYMDIEWTEEQIRKRNREIAELRERDMK